MARLLASNHLLIKCTTNTDSIFIFYLSTIFHPVILYYGSVFLSCGIYNKNRLIIIIIIKVIVFLQYLHLHVTAPTSPPVISGRG